MPAQGTIPGAEGAMERLQAYADEHDLPISALPALPLEPARVSIQFDTRGAVVMASHHKGLDAAAALVIHTIDIIASGRPITDGS